MAALKALQNAIGTLTGNPVLLLVGLAIGIVTLPQTALGLLSVPLVPQALQVVTFFITPLLAAALIGMADEALSGPGTSVETGRSVGVDRYVPLLLGTIVKFAIDLVFGVVIAITVFVGVLLGFGAVASAGAGDVNLGSLGGAVLVVGLVVLLVAVVYLVVQFFIQFFHVSIVAGREDFLDGFRDSVGLVRNNLLATLGYSVINLIVAILVSLPVVGFTVFRTLQQVDDVGAGAGAGAGAGGFGPGAGAGASLFSLPEVLALSAIALLLTSVLQPFNLTFATSFYRLHSEGSRNDPDPESTTVTEPGTDPTGGFDD
jgi:hypothetical protein